MTELITSFYEEKTTFTANKWEKEEVSYITNSDFAYIFFGTENEKQSVMDYLEDHFDSMFVTSDDGALVFFTNEELSIDEKQDIEFELGIDGYSQFTGTSGIYTEIDLDAD